MMAPGPPPPPTWLLFFPTGARIARRLHYWSIEEAGISINYGPLTGLHS